MTHDEAVKDGATERYVLDEMTDEERDAFEEHYFECAVCAEDVRAAITLRDGLAAVHRHEPVPNVVPFQPRRWSLPTSLGAVAASAMITVFSMNAAIVQPLRQSLRTAQQPVSMSTVMQLLQAPIVHLQATRAEAQHVSVIQHDQDSKLEFDVAGEENRTTPYTCTIVDRRGSAIYSIPVSAQEAKEEFVRLLVRKNSLEPGNYRLQIDTKPVATDLPFTVR
jgi:hypothetical protein